MPEPFAAAAAWCWRLIVVGAVVYGAARVFDLLDIVTIPCVAGLLITALLYPVAARFRALGLPRLSATWLTFLCAALVVAGLGALIGIRAQAEFPTLVSEALRTTHELQHWLRHGPFHIKQTQLQNMVGQLLNELQRQQSKLASTAIAGASFVIEFLIGLVLLLFVTFFLVKDGDTIWGWFLDRLHPRARDRFGRAGRVAWLTLVQYVRGTVVIAAVHALVLGVVMLIMRIPLWAPLAVLIFLGSFIPLAGILVTGGLAIAITLGTQGWVPAVILLCVLIVEAQLESHLLQPQIVGRMVRLHPLAIILAIATGTLVDGIVGAVVAVPLVAIIYRTWPELRRSTPEATATAETVAGEQAGDGEAGGAATAEDG